MTGHRLRTSLVAGFMLAVVMGISRAGTATVAVAANFAAPAKALSDRFMRSSEHRITLSTGSTGKLYAQIEHGAPFQAFLAADQERPERLEEEGLGVPGSRFTYALGQLALWSPLPEHVDDQASILKEGKFRRLAIANPKLAPYGAAAQETLQQLGIWSQLRRKLVIGENIAQTFQFVSTGNAEFGFVALSQILGQREPTGSYWLVPRSLYAPIRQDAVLLTEGRGNLAAEKFMHYLKSISAKALIQSYGYDLP
jgi:molybdate transport system substrate-binding protein